MFLDFRVWMGYLVTQGLPGPEANLAWTVTTAQEEIQGFQGKEVRQAQEAPRAFLEKKEKKEIQCSL